MMKRNLFLLLLVIPVLTSGQIANFAKTLPERAFSIGISPAYHIDRNVILFDAGGPAVGLSGGYGLQYSLDVNARYIYFHNGADYIGVDMQYLLHEARESYFSVIAGNVIADIAGYIITAISTLTRTLYHKTIITRSPFVVASLRTPSAFKGGVVVYVVIV